MMLVLLLLLVFVAACVGMLLLLIIRARSKRLLLNATRAALSDTPGSIGISVLCSGVSDLAQIENLLSVEYPRYEVVVVLDARRHAAEFAALVARYRMIRVEWAYSGELEVVGVRTLGRSRKRPFRRFVLVDRAADSPAGDFDAAAAVAAYDYLLPLVGGQCLLRGAIERLVVELGESPSRRLDLIRSYLGEPAVLICRETVVAAGGFGLRPLREIPLCRRRIVWEPLLGACAAGERTSIWTRGLAAVLLGAAFAVVVSVGWWAAAAVLATLGLIWAGMAYALRLAGVAVPSSLGSFATWRRLFRSYY